MIYKGYISGLKWSGMMEFLHEGAAKADLDIKITMDDKGLIHRTIYFTLEGEENKIKALVNTMKKTVTEYNGDIDEKAPPKDIKEIIKFESSIEVISKELKKITDRLPKHEETGSDFGKGFLYCLALFTTHFTNGQMENIKSFKFVIDMNPKDRELAMSDNPPSRLKYGKDMDYAFFQWKEIMPIYGNAMKPLSSSITLWANGASDHLYELECPKKYKGTVIEKKVKELQDLGLEMGHGYKLNKIYTMKDVEKLQTLTADIFKAVDKDLGVKVIEAKWGEL